MPQSSPYDLIRKATRHATATDRWAALQASAQERTPVTPPPVPGPEAVPAPPPYSAPSDRLESPAQAGYPQLAQPPFPPPQPRHPHLDEIAQRHTQAIKTALKPQEWSPRRTEDVAVSPPANQNPGQTPPAPES